MQVTMKDIILICDLYLLTDGPEPLKENDLRTASFVIEVFGEELVSTWFVIKLKFSVITPHTKLLLNRRKASKVVY